ncbi:hypothetical protein ACP70R_040881 [Stipagrostis hirtigluma subsp. patula]
MAPSPWDKLGWVASVTQLAGVDAMGLVSMIMQAAQLARGNRDLCLQLSQHVEIVGDLVRELQIPELRRHPETRRPLDQLHAALCHTYELVRSCSQQQQTRSLVRQMLTAASVADELRRAQEVIDRYITLIPVITAVAVIKAQGALRVEAPSLSVQEVTVSGALEGPLPIGTVAVQIKEGTQQSAIVEEVPSPQARERRRRGDPSSCNDSAAEEFTLDQLSRATRGFSLDFRLGYNQFCTWYWGDLGDGREVTIIRFKLGPHGPRYRKEYRSGLAFISNLQHRNLMRLVGYCIAPERLLVYDFMKNLTLYGQLNREASMVVSSWKLRISILLDASRGIDYLHSCAAPPPIHGNITSANILLDGEWTARVSDFVRPLLEPELDRLRAVGYLDPEHGVLRRLTVKSDVYAFGVVMLQVVTGRASVFKEFKGGRSVSLVSYAVPIIAAGELREVLDPRAPELAAHEVQAVELVASTAVLCVQPEGKDRPMMADIVAMLETAVELFEGRAPAQLSLPSPGVQICDAKGTLQVSLAQSSKLVFQNKPTFLKTSSLP